MQTCLRPVVRNEWQLLYVCHLVGPILNRLTSEKPKLLLEVRNLSQSVTEESRGKNLMMFILFRFHNVYRLSWRYTF